jgi:hypothetical protein
VVWIHWQRVLNAETASFEAHPNQKKNKKIKPFTYFVNDLDPEGNVQTEFT